MGACDSKEKISENIINDIIGNIVNFVKERNIDLNHIHDISEEDKKDLIQKFNDLFEYLASFLFDDKLKDEMNDGFIEEFKYTISEEKLSKIRNKKSFIKMKESIQNLMNDSQDFLDFISKFKHVYENKDLIFKSEIEDSNEELKNSLNYVLSYLNKKNDDMNILNNTMKNLNNSLSKISPLLENIVRRQEIEKELSDLKKSLDTKYGELEQIKKLISSLDYIEKNKKVETIKNVSDLANEMTQINTKRSNLLNELQQLTNESFNQCTTEQQELFEKYRSNEITKEEFYEKIYQKPLDEIDDLRYQGEIRRIIEIYNNSSKTIEDKKDIITKMDNFIISIKSVPTIFNCSKTGSE